MEKTVWIVVNAMNQPYEGWFKRRVDAKLSRVSASLGKPVESKDGKSMDEKHEEIWESCAQLGDKVVKAKLSW